MSNIVVGISDLKVSRSPDVLVTYALGSCVGICIYDSVAKIGGLSHIMLPNSSLASNPQPIQRFADTAIEAMVRELEGRGARRTRMTAKIAGGAQMFNVNGSLSPISNIGARNVKEVKNVLAALRIPIIAEDVGQNFGRTLYFTLEDGIMTIKSAVKGEWAL